MNNIAVRIVALVLCLATAPFAAEAPKAGRCIASGCSNLDAFRQGLRELGYVEGQNLVIEFRSPAGRPGVFPDLAAELVRLKVDLILTRGTAAVTAAKNATRSIPIVMATSGTRSGPAWSPGSRARAGMSRD